ncbi:MAG: hypothetical protein IKC90_09210 [Akkermansia sp.]|nr:hypothetical protein [Akkermansia sp.]
MGFTTLATVATIAKALPDALQAHALNKQSKSLNSIAGEQELLAARQAAHMENAAVSNQQRGAKNAAAHLAAARADAAASNLATEGSAHLREQDLVTRLQDEINLQANAMLDKADQIRKQGALNAWNTRHAAAQAKAGSIGAAFGTVGSLFSSVAKQLNNQSKS